jgi:glyoxylate/hydroxypyruvate reductase A
MRLHIQNTADDPSGALTPALWAEALARHPDLAGLQASFADDPAGLAAGAEAELLVARPRTVMQLRKALDLPAAMPRLRAIYITVAGVDRLQPFDWVPPGVALLNNRGAHGQKAGEYGLMAVLMLRNMMPALIGAQQDGRWDRLASTSVAGHPLVVVGVGGLGGAVARLARQLGMRVIGVRRGAAPHPDCDATMPLEAALPQAETLLLTCPLTPATRNLLSREAIARLPRGAGVINMARGPVWDQEAVCDALDSGHLAGAITDVTEPEPLPPGHRMWRTRNLVITPHVSSDDTEHYNARTLDTLLANIRAARDGKPYPNLVDMTEGY